MGLDVFYKKNKIIGELRSALKLEDLKNFKKLSEDMTDEQWQEYFKLMKLIISQSKQRRMSTRNWQFTVNGYRDDSQFAYHGETQWSRYCQFINSTLQAIRFGEYEYCFYIYQIADLLRFEHDRLRTQWLPEHKQFLVWLEK